MRKEKLKRASDFVAEGLSLEEAEEKDMEQYEIYGHADWRENPSDVLSTIDGLLEQHGLEILEYETEADFYLFEVVKKA